MFHDMGVASYVCVRTYENEEIAINKECRNNDCVNRTSPIHARQQNQCVQITNKNMLCSYAS